MSAFDESVLSAALRDLGRTAAVIKNPDIWQSLSRGGDIDLLALHPKHCRDALIKHLGAPTTETRRSYVWSLSFEGIRIDLLPRLEWRGLRLLSAERALAGAHDGKGVPLPIARVGHQALAGIVYPLLAHGSYKARYEEVWMRAWLNDSVELRELLDLAFGRSVRSFLGPTPPSPSVASRLRHMLVRRQFARHPVISAGGTGRHAVRELRIRWRHND